MTLEVATYINQLNASYPEGGADRSTADDHLRLIKSTVLATFPAVTGPVTVTHTELNLLAGATTTLASVSALTTKYSLSISANTADIARISQTVSVLWAKVTSMSALDTQYSLSISQIKASISALTTSLNSVSVVLNTDLHSVSAVLQASLSSVSAALQTNINAVSNTVSIISVRVNTLSVTVAALQTDMARISQTVSVVIARVATMSASVSVLTALPRVYAWVTFNGSATVSIIASYNVTSVDDNGTGDYTVNFTNVLTTGYAVMGWCNGWGVMVGGNEPTTFPEAASCRIRLRGHEGSAVDSSYVSAVFLR